MQQCSKCNGVGIVPLTGRALETYHLLRRQRAPINGADLARQIDIAETAMNNRLARLERLGLAARQINGVESLWVAK